MKLLAITIHSYNRILLLFCLFILTGIVKPYAQTANRHISKKQAKLHLKHSTWRTVLVINNQNDTAALRIKEMPDVSLNQWFKGNTIIVTDSSDKEVQLGVDDFKSFIVSGDSGAEKYVAFAFDEYGGRIYRIYVEGEWSVLAYNIVHQGQLGPPSPYTIAVAARGNPYKQGQSPVLEKFLLYNTSSDFVKQSAVNADDPNFTKPSCQAIITKCPETFKKVKNKSSLYFDDVVELAIGFNKCLTAPYQQYPRYDVYPE